MVWPIWEVLGQLVLLTISQQECNEEWNTVSDAQQHNTGYAAVAVCGVMQCNACVVQCVYEECCVWISCHSPICLGSRSDLLMRCIVLTYARARKRWT